MNMESHVNNLIILCNKPANHSDYIVDGLLYCGKCKTPKQVKLEAWRAIKIFPCNCVCKSTEYELRKEQDDKEEAIRKIKRLKIEGIQDKLIHNWTFANDNNNMIGMTNKALKYCKQWEQMYNDNIGLLFWGNIGTGKTYFASCIANDLLDKGVSVMMTNFSKILNALSGFAQEDKNEYINKLNYYKLLIIDDLGVERQSEFAQEIVYNVIDSRCKNGQPIIITTNLTIDEIKKPKNIAHSRIYDRILEMCVPIHFEGMSQRKKTYQSKLDKAKSIFDDSI